MNAQVTPGKQSSVSSSVYAELLGISFQQDSFFEQSSIQPTIAEFERFLQLSFAPKNTIKREWFQKKNKLLQKPTGSKWNNFVNIREFEGNNDENSSYSFNGAHIRSGIEWDLLDGGVIGNSRDRKILENEYSIFKLEEEIKHRKYNYPYLHNLLLQLFNQQKIKVLQQRVKTLENIIAAVYKLYNNHLLSYDVLNLYKSKLEESFLLLEAFEQYNKGSASLVKASQATNFDAERLPFFEVNLEKLLQDDTYSQNQLEQNRLRKEIIDWQYDRQKDRRLKIYSRLNFRSRTEGLPKISGMFALNVNRFN